MAGTAALEFRELTSSAMQIARYFTIFLAIFFVALSSLVVLYLRLSRRVLIGCDFLSLAILEVPFSCVLEYMFFQYVVCKN